MAIWQYPHRDESGRVRFRHQAIDFTDWKPPSPRRCATSNRCARHGAPRPRPNGRMRRCRAILAESGAAARRRGGAGELEGQRREIATLFTDITISPRWSNHWSRACSGRCSTIISPAMTDIVFAHKAPAKIIGDAIPRAVRRAGRAARPCHSRRSLCAGARRLCASRCKRYRRKVCARADRGLGAACGSGDRRRLGAATFSTTPAYGDTINVAAPAWRAPIAAWHPHLLQ